MERKWLRAAADAEAQAICKYYEKTILSELVGILRIITLNTAGPSDAISTGVLCHFDAPTSTARFSFTSRF